MSSTVTAPTPLLSDRAIAPDADNYIEWKSTFLDYLDLLGILSPTLTQDKPTKLEFFRNKIGSEGQRHYAVRKLRSKSRLDDAFAVLDKLSDATTNVYAAQFKFSKITQNPGESIDSFASRPVQGLGLYEY